MSRYLEIRKQNRCHGLKTESQFRCTYYTGFPETLKILKSIQVGPKKEALKAVFFLQSPLPDCDGLQRTHKYREGGTSDCTVIALDGLQTIWNVAF